MIDFFQNINFVNPYLLALAILPIAWYVYRRISKSRQSYIMMSSASPFEATKNWRSKWTGLPDILRLLAMISLVVALARPQLALSEEEVNAEGIDIMLAMDLSSSMLAKDFEPDRLEVSKKVAADFVAKRPYDRIGLAVFAGEAFTQCPLTTDQLIIQDFLGSLAVGILDDGTAIGMGLATAVNRLKDSETKSKIVILLTDGVNNTGYINPLTAAEIAKEYGIKVYTIGVGTEGTALTPVNRRSNGQYIFRQSMVQIDEQLLQQISNDTGGRYFRAKDQTDLEDIYNYIDQLEKTEIEVNVFKKYKEEFRIFLLLALGLLFAEFLIQKLVLNVLE